MTIRAAMHGYMAEHPRTMGVPLDELRGALPDMDRTALDGALMSMFRRGMIDLQSVHNPLALPPARRAAGIWDARGEKLYFYAEPLYRMWDV